jgi:hypothetical protein
MHFFHPFQIHVNRKFSHHTYLMPLILSQSFHLGMFSPLVKACQVEDTTTTYAPGIRPTRWTLQDALIVTYHFETLTAMERYRPGSYVWLCLPIRSLAVAQFLVAKQFITAIS